MTITGVGTTLDVLNSATVTGIETVNIRATTANSLNASQISGLTAVNSTGAGTVLVTNLATGASIGIVGNGSLVQGEVAFAPATASAPITLNISGGVAQTATNDGITAAATIAAGDATGTATTATVNSSGAANTTGVIDLANATLTSVTINAATNLTADFLSQATDQVATGGTLTINGAATLVTLSAALDNDLAVINASGMTAGGISVTLGTLATQTVTGGAGADTITTSAVLTTGSVNAGAGTDTLVVANATHLGSPALAAKYTNFETLRIATGLTMDMANAPAGITTVETAGVATISNMTPTQASSVLMRTNATAGTADALNLQLAAQSGTSDVLTITAGTGLTTTGALDIAALNVTGFETLNLKANPGPTSTAGAGGAGDRTTNITGTITGPTLNKITLTGTAVNIANVATTVPVTIDGSALTGDGLAAASQAGLTVAGSAVVGSTITGSGVRDVFTIGAEGSAYNGGAGNDRMTTTVAVLVSDGTDDGTLNGGDGTDTLVVSDTTTTLTDNHFIKVSNFEALTLSNTVGDASITTGGAFNSAFANGVTIATGTLAATKDITFTGGLATVPITITVDATLLTGAATDTNSITTGSANDTITFNTTAATYVGVAGAEGSVVINAKAGNDTITFNYGQLLASTSVQAFSITGGSGADTITKGTGSLNSTTVTSTTVFNFAAGDSGTTLATQDKITGFSLAGVAAGTLSDVLNFEGTATVSAFTSSIDFGTILTHSITGGIVTFDTAATFAAAKIINSSNLGDVVGYLNANLGVNETVGFLYDSNGDGANDATMVFHQGSNLTTVADDLVQLVGTTGLSLNATLTTATAGCIAIA